MHHGFPVSLVLNFLTTRLPRLVLCTPLGSGIQSWAWWTVGRLSRNVASDPFPPLFLSRVPKRGSASLSEGWILVAPLLRTARHENSRIFQGLLNPLLSEGEGGGECPGLAAAWEDERHRGTAQVAVMEICARTTPQAIRLAAVSTMRA